jgi:haloalkane dehalogenase
MSIDFATPHSFLDVGHSQLAYYKFGRGPDLVFVHGWPLSAATWRHLVTELAEHYTCHLIDLPGTGNTKTGPSAKIDLREHAVTVRAAIDRLKLERYALVAHDSGGFVARLVAADDPRATALVLGNTEIPNHTPPAILAFIALQKLGLGRTAMNALLRSSWLRRSALGFGGCFTHAEYVDGDFKTVLLDPLATPEGLAGHLRLLDGISSKTLAGMRELHARISIPTALVWGTDDPWFPLAKARPMMAQFAGPTRLFPIEGGKLFVHEDRAREFAVATREFLSTNFGNQGAAEAIGPHR